MRIHVQAAPLPSSPGTGTSAHHIRQIAELRERDRATAGGKGANLGELHSAHVPVPAGFVITAQAYLQSMDAGGVRTKLRELSRATQPENPEALAQHAEALRALVREAGVSAELRVAILEAYAALGDETRVAVRSSATLEALDSAAGMNETFTNVHGDEALLDAVVSCWMGVFVARAVAYRALNQIEDEPAIAVVVQHMINAEKAGVAFTTDPDHPAHAQIAIRAAFGLGTVVSTGQVESDTYLVDKKSMRLVEARVGTKSHKIVAGEHGDLGIALGSGESRGRVLTDHQVCELAGMAADIERHYGAPQELEWAILEGTPYILRSRKSSTTPV